MTYVIQTLQGARRVTEAEGGKILTFPLQAQLVKNLPATQETLVRFLGQEDPLEKEIATHSGILAWRIIIDKGAWQALGLQRIGYD